MNLPPYGDDFRRHNNHFSSLKVTPTPDPCMRLQVTPGIFWRNGKKLIEYKGGSSPDFEAPSVNSKYSLLVLNYSGNLRVIDGQQSSSPQLPECPTDSFPLSAVYLKRTDTKITSDMIFDIRGFNLSVLRNHKELSNCEDNDCHPIDSITGLRTILDHTPSNQDVQSVLLTKADKDGTPDTRFILNKDHTGDPVSDVSIEVERGSSSNVFFRWNEQIHCWEYSNDGENTIQLTNVGPSINFPKATTTTLGGIIVGNRLSVDSSGKIHADFQSEANFTTFEKEKLGSVEEGANNYEHPTTHPASMIGEEFNLRFMTDAEKQKLAGIEDYANKYLHPETHDPSIIVQDDLNQFVTLDEKNKLRDIEERANRYIHPANHRADIITEDSNHRFVTDEERIKLAGIEDVANNYVHPTFHDAAMIQTDATHRFVSDMQISGWNNKAELADVDARLEELIGIAPDALDTLGEIAKSIGDDADFIGTITNQLSNKVDKISGKGLSTEDFTTIEKSKLAGVEVFANKYEHPANHPASMIIEDSSRRFVTDLERQKIENVPIQINDILNNKVDVLPGKGLSTEDFTTTEKSKLDTVENGANNYIHPTTHPASIIVEDSAKQFVSDAEKTLWGEKDQYDCGNPIYWNASSPPSNISSAIDRLAQAIYSLNGNQQI